MNWDALFGLTNIVALAGWVALAVLPRGPKIMAMVLYVGVSLLCVIYAALFSLLIGKAIEPGLAAGASGGGGFTSIGGIRALFMSDAGVVIGWTHYLAFDLFVGLWIAKDADHKGFSRLVQLPFLFATLIAGPIGLLLWLLVREKRARRAARQA